MYNNPYQYNPQASIDRINTQMNELEQMKQRLQQSIQQPAPTNLTQNFQISPINREVIRYANSMEEVQREMIIGDTPYFSKDMSVVWIKNTKGEIKTYELVEIVPKDEKDIQISYLQAQIEELKGMIKNDEHLTNANAKQNATNTPINNESIREEFKDEKPTSISKVSRSKKE